MVKLKVLMDKIVFKFSIEGFENHIIILLDIPNHLFCANGSEEGSWIEAFDKLQIATGIHEWLRLD